MIEMTAEGRAFNPPIEKIQKTGQNEDDHG